MYTRITTFNVNPESFDESDALAAKIKPAVLAIPGVEHYFRARNEDGTATTIAIYKDREAADAATDTVKGLFAQFADFMTSPPQASGYEIKEHGSN